MKTTFERLKAILLKTYRVDAATLTPQLQLSQLGIDSLGLGLLLFDVEDEFTVKFTSEPGPLQTLGDVVVYIDEVMTTQLRSTEFLLAASAPSQPVS